MNKEQEESKNELEKKRHTLAHLLAAAVLEHYPQALPTIGPATGDGFYYDFDFGEEKITPEDFKKIEKTMRKLLPSWTEFTHETMEAEAARQYFADNPYKLELIDGIVEAGEPITFYTAGEFTDLCRGGHSANPSTDITPDSFKLTRIAGAYWRGDESKPMLTRIYGLAFATKDDLKAHQKMLAEAKTRDHRKLGQELDLFTFSPLVGAGLPLFTPRGTAMRDAIIDKIHTLQTAYGYSRVSIPHITKKDLYQTSGHWEKFGDELFKVTGKDGEEFVMKPMNCPHHTQIYTSQPRSYKDLPIRYTESTMVYRDEQSGELLGLSRVRSITQDDGHVFCTPEQIGEEINIMISVIRDFYTSLDMWNDDNFWVSISVRDLQTPEKYLGDDTKWDEAEATLEKIAEENNLPFRRVEGEAAFYGPKLDFQFKDAIGREWQLATAQLDFVMPERFGLEYTDNTGTKQTPVMIHRAIAGSLERFMSVIIEHFAGHFPLWLAPEQVRVIPITDEYKDFANEIFARLQSAGWRVSIDDGTDNLGKKIRSVKKLKTPYWLVIGDQEVSSQTVTLENKDGKKYENISIDELLEKLQTEV